MKSIDSLPDYISVIQEITNNNSQRFVFRGQSNNTWPLSSSAARRIRKTLFNSDNEKFQVSKHIFLQYNRRIIDEYNLKGINRKNNVELSELEILSEMQHFGAATCLVDFSLNSLIALFFVCNSENEKMNDGAVFIVDITNCDNYSSLEHSMLKNKIDFFLEQEPKFIKGPSEYDELIEDDEGVEHRNNMFDETISPKIWFWEAPHINQRIPIQQSIFLFGKPNLIYDKKIIIPSTIKETLIKELDRCFNINEETLFPDFSGFSKNHEVTKGCKFWSLGTRLWAASECLKNGEKIDVDPFLEEIRKNASKKITTYSDNLLLICSNLKKLNELKNLCYELIQKSPNEPEYYLFLSKIYNCLGNPEERYKWLGKCQDVAKRTNDDMLFCYCQSLLENPDEDELYL